MKQTFTALWTKFSKRNHPVVKFGVLIAFLGIVFMLSFSRFTDVDASDSIPVLDDGVNPVLEVSTYSSKLKGSGETCDLFKGDWIPDKAVPAYTNKSCKWIENDQNCMRNGRPDTEFLNWRWKPRDCELPQFNAEAFLKLMTNKSWALVGDSITRNHIQSLLCILSKVEEAIEVYYDKEYKSRRWQFPSYNLSISVIWSPFLAKASIIENIQDISIPEIKLHLDLLDKSWTDLYKHTDYIVFSSGIWFSRTAFYYENDEILGCHYCQGKNYTDPGFDFAYRKVLKNFFKFIINSNHKGIIFYRSTTPDHFEDGEWNSGGDCKRKKPANEGDFELKLLIRILREIELDEFEKAETEAFEKGVKLKLLDVTPLSLLRPDGHPGPYRTLNPFAKNKDEKEKEQAVKTMQTDCLHWCLPGPIDHWNDLLMEMVING